MIGAALPGWGVRPADSKDADDLAALERVAMGAASWGERSIRESFDAAHVFIFLAARPGKTAPCGYAVWRRLGADAEILSLGVAPPARRQGAGAALLSAVLSAAKKQALNRVFLEVAADNAAARALYSAASFEKIGLRRGYYRNGGDAVIMSKNI